MTAALTKGYRMRPAVSLALATLATTGALVPTAAQAQSFAVTPALQTLRGLTAFGPRIPGTDAYRRAGDWLAAQLRRAPRISVIVDDERGVQPSDAQRPDAVAYSIRNVVAHLPGSSREAIAFVAHYDSAFGSPGGADDGAAVAALVQVALDWAKRNPPSMSVVFIFDGGEETAFLGASAYRNNPYRADIRALVNLDALGGTGPPTVVRASSDALPLLRAFGQASPAPAASAVGSDLLAAGLLGSNTSYGFYRAVTPVPSLDVALIGNGYFYHLPLDTADRVSSASLQQLGEVLTGLIKGMSPDPTRAAVGAGPNAPPLIYYDVLGAALLAYDRRVDLVLVAVAALLVGALVVRHRIGVVLAHSLARGAVAGACALGSATFAALLVGFALHRPLAWFAHPARGVVAFALAAALGAAAGARLIGWRSPRRGDDVDGDRIALVTFGLGLYAVATIVGAGAGYLALWWMAPMLAFLLLPRRRRAGPIAFLAVVPGVLITAREWLRVVVAVIPIFGRTQTVLPADVVIAFLAAIPVLAVAAVFAWMGWRIRADLRRPAVLTLAASTVIASGVLALSPPFSADCPKRLIVDSVAGDTPHLAVRAFEPVALTAALGPGIWSRCPPFERRDWRGPMMVIGSADRLPPRVIARVAAIRQLPNGYREIDLHVGPGAPLTTVHVPRPDLIAWSWGQLPVRGATSDDVVALIVGDPPGGVILRLTLRSPEPVKVRLDQIELAGTPATSALVEVLPSWASARQQQVFVQWLTV